MRVGRHLSPIVTIQTLSDGRRVHHSIGERVLNSLKNKGFWRFLFLLSSFMYVLPLRFNRLLYICSVSEYCRKCGFIIILCTLYIGDAGVNVLDPLRVYISQLSLCIIY